MTKQAKYSTAKVKQIYKEYPIEFSATPVGDLRCNVCVVLVKCHKKFFVESRQKISNAEENWRRRANSKVSKTFSQLDQKNFTEKVVSSFLAAETQPSFFKISVCYNKKSNAFGDSSPGICLFVILGFDVMFRFAALASRLSD